MSLFHLLVQIVDLFRQSNTTALKGKGSFMNVQTKVYDEEIRLNLSLRLTLASALSTNSSTCSLPSCLVKVISVVHGLRRGTNARFKSLLTEFNATKFCK